MSGVGLLCVCVRASERVCACIHDNACGGQITNDLI